MTAHEEAATPYVGDAPVNDDVKTLFSKQNGLQAVRGLGTSLVVFHHMTGELVNAAAVFDAFFVISGYLISIRLILLAQTASIRDYFLTFYTFRIRRIFPVAILTLLATALVAHLIYLPSRAHDVTVDVVYALFFFANVHYAHDGTNYFHQGGVVSPVLNFWSLSVEEQFYLAWPLVILVALWVAHRRGRGTGVTPVALVIIAASFVYGWWDTATHPVAAYYSTFGRVWDFGIGALMANLAVGQAQHGSGTRGPSSGKAPVLVRLNRRFAPYAGQIVWVGIVLFLLAMFFTPEVGYPVPAAAFGMVGMGIVFFANTLKRDPSRLFANARPFIWLGDMSYSLYVVHFPVIVFASSYIKGDTTLLYAFDVAASLSLAVLLFNFVEKPARQSLGRTRAWVRAGGHRTPLLQAMTCAFVAAVLFALAPRGVAVPDVALARGPQPTTTPSTSPVSPTSSTASTVSPPAPSSSAAPHLNVPAIPDELKAEIPPDLLRLALRTPQSFTDPNLVPPTDQLGAAIAQGVSLTAWPRLTNESRVGRIDFAKACDVIASTSPPCIARPAGGVDPAKVAVGVGDSTMLAYWPMLRGALVSHGWTVVMFGLGSCPAALVSVHAPTVSPEACDRHHAAYAGLLARWKPSLVFMSDAESEPYSVSVSAADGATPLRGAAGRAAYAQGLAGAITAAQGVGARVVVLSPPPARQPISSCDVAGSSPRDCLNPLSGVWPTLNRIDRQVSTATGATYADLLGFVCFDLRCPAVVDGLVVGADYIHLTPEYVALLVPSFERYLVRSGLVS